MNCNNNNFDIYKKGELPLFMEGKFGTNNFDFFRKNEIYRYIYKKQSSAPPVPIIVNRRRIMIIE